MRHRGLHGLWNVIEFLADVWSASCGARWAACLCPAVRSPALLRGQELHSAKLSGANTRQAIVVRRDKDDPRMVIGDCVVGN